MQTKEGTQRAPSLIKISTNKNVGVIHELPLHFYLLPRLGRLD
jgi:hypothetical protein